jgi:hypothetical protein
MTDFHAAQVRGHRRNMERYCRLLRPISPSSSGSRALSRFVLELGDTISGISRVPSQAARSIG